ncbi:MAG TPA: alpha/beta hydrolase [Anaerolineae bacterium]|nr:alpha/beta hydrolase [Anaerolineae bacterium]
MIGQANIVIKISRFLSGFSVLMAIFTFIRSESGLLSVLLWIPKALAGGFSLLATLSGILGSILGLLNRDLRSAVLGLFGASMSARYVIKVAASHGGFEEVFGPDWEAYITPEVKKRMYSKRWTPLPKNPPEIPWRQDIHIATDPEDGDRLYADLWIPPDREYRTGLGVIYLHGSGWHYGNKDMRTRHFFRHLTNQGHVIIDFAYRLAPNVDLHQMLFDVKRAINWMKTNAVDYGVDAKKVVLMGGSAGAQLALLAAYTPNDPHFQPKDIQVDTSVCGVVSYYGPTDLVELHRYFESKFRRIPTRSSFSRRVPISRWEDRARRTGFLPPNGRFVAPMEILPSLMGDAPERVIDLYRLGSPINHVGGHCPPTLLLQGLHDFGGMVNQARMLHNALCRVGVRSILVEFLDTEHGFDLFLPKWSPATQAATYDTERFLALLSFSR